MHKEKHGKFYKHLFVRSKKPRSNSASGALPNGTLTSQVLCFIGGVFSLIGGVFYLFYYFSYRDILSHTTSSCTQTADCSGSLGTWGQYSPWAPAPSKIDPEIPPQCKVNFVQLLARHGSRGPTTDKAALYTSLVEELHESVTDYTQGFEFIKDYQYTLVPGDLSPYGQQEMMNAGRLFYERYKDLVVGKELFVRASGSDRVVMSARNFTRGYYEAQGRHGDESDSRILVIPEGDGFNNTLDHGNCQSFEKGAAKKEGTKWNKSWVPSVQKRLNKKLPGARFDESSTVSFMELCPFESVSFPELRLSAFCRAFSDEEWRNYDYYQSLEKWYVYGPGRDLAASQGVGFVNELLARLTGKPVEDHTSTNTTLDASPETFPLDRSLYADFSHDNSMMTVFTALRLFEGIKNLPSTKRLSPDQLDGYSASRVVPFGARMYVEKMRCSSGDGNDSDAGEDLVRILVNDRVVPLRGCNADKLGRCRLDKFVESMSFARSGGEWSRCSV